MAGHWEFHLCSALETVTGWDGLVQAPALAGGVGGNSGEGDSCGDDTVCVIIPS